VFPSGFVKEILFESSEGKIIDSRVFGSEVNLGLQSFSGSLLLENVVLAIGDKLAGKDNRREGKISEQLSILSSIGRCDGVGVVDVFSRDDGVSFSSGIPCRVQRNLQSVAIIKIQDVEGAISRDYSELGDVVINSKIGGDAEIILDMIECLVSEVGEILV